MKKILLQIVLWIGFVNFLLLLYKAIIVVWRGGEGWQNEIWNWFWSLLSLMFVAFLVAYWLISYSDHQSIVKDEIDEVENLKRPTF